MGVRGLGRYLVTHPGDVAVVVSSAWALRRSHWWRQWPPLPIPGRDYWNFRIITAYGVNGAPTPRDVVAAARWSRSVRTTR